MSIAVLLEIQAQGGKGAELEALLAEILPGTRSYEGCEGLEVLRAQDDPTRYVLVEHWSSRERYDSYVAWRGETGVLERLGALLAGPPQMRFFDPTGL